MLGIRPNGLREMLRVQREEHATTRALIASQREEIRSEREEIRRKGEERTEQMRREGEERTEQMRQEGDERTAEMREFMREILLRNEKVYTAVIAEMEKQGKRLDEGTAQLAANTKAVLSVLDRLNGSAPAT